MLAIRGTGDVLLLLIRDHDNENALTVGEKTASGRSLVFTELGDTNGLPRRNS
jgi:hypothetical protein